MSERTIRLNAMIKHTYERSDPSSWLLFAVNSLGGFVRSYEVVPDIAALLRLGHAAPPAAGPAVQR